MEKKGTKYFDVIIEALFLIIVFLAPTIFDRRIGIVFSLTKATTIRAFTIFILGVWATKIVVNREHKFMRTLPDWPVLTYILACTVATITSVHVFVSFFGFYGRYEGLITLYNYVLLFFVVTNFCKTRISLKRILATVTCAGTVMAIYGIIQRFKWDPFAWGGVITWHRVIATIGQPNFLAAYMNMAFLLALALFFFEGEENKPHIETKNDKKLSRGRSLPQEDWLEKLFPAAGFFVAQIVFIALIFTIREMKLIDVIFWYFGFSIITTSSLYFAYNFEKIDPVVIDVIIIISLVFTYICLLFTQSRGGYLGLLVGGILFILLMNRKVLFRHWKKAAIFFFIIFTITAVILSNPVYSPLARFALEVRVQETEPGVEKAKPEIEKDKDKEQKEEDLQSETTLELRGAAGSRAETWKSAFKIIADRPFFGIGQEVLKMIFPQYETELFRFKEAFHVKQDRCHNSVFDKAVTRGVITLLIYVWVLFSVFKLGFKKIDRIQDEEGKLIVSALLAAIASYLVQNQFSFGVVAIGSLLWIMMGMVSIIDEEKELPSAKHKPLEISDIPWLPVAGIATLVVILLIISSIPFRADRHYKSGKVLTDRKMIDDALREFDMSMAINPYEGGTNTYYGIAHLNKAYNVSDKEKRKEWFYKAINVLKRATLVDPYNADNFFILGKSYLTLSFEGEKDALEKSLINSMKAISIDPYYAEAYYNIGLVYERVGESSLALVNYERAFMINPSLSDSMGALISFYSRLGFPQKAVETMEEAYKKYPNYVQVVENLGVAYIFAREFDKAIETFKKMPSRKEKDKIKQELNIARAYFEKGDLDSSLDYYMDVIMVDPANIDAHNSIGLIYLRKGNKVKAREKFEEVLMIDPKNSFAKKMLEELKK